MIFIGETPNLKEAMRVLRDDRSHSIWTYEPFTMPTENDRRGALALEIRTLCENV
jgi:hypothetical protein